MRTKRIILVLLVALMSVAGAWAHEHRFAADDEAHSVCLDCGHGFFRYEAASVVAPYTPSELKGADGNALTIISNTCTDGHGVIEFDRPLVTIGYKAFLICFGFTGSLTIPNSVTSIGNYAFNHCSGFTGDLTIGNSVTSIGFGAFSGCTGFTGSLTIPNSVTSIGGYAFNNCYGLTGNLTIPNSVTSIGECAFCECTGFTGSLTIPNSVTTIGDWAFEQCNGFKVVYVEWNSPLNIYETIFRQWSFDTKKLHVPHGAEDAYRSASVWGEFGEIDSHFYADDDAAHSVCTVCGHGIFHYESSTNAVVEPYNKANLLDANDQQYISNLYRTNSIDGSPNNGGIIEFAAPLKTIGRLAFETRPQLIGKLTIPSTVTTIGWRAFGDCNGFTGDLVIPNSVTTLDNLAFQGCSGFNGKLTISNSITKIGSSTFNGCSGLTGDLVIPNSVTTIGSSAFDCCTGFNGKLIIGNSVTSIGERAFINCTGLTGDLVFPNSVTDIGNMSFYDCTGINGKLVIGNSVETIQGYAFSGCSNLSDVTLRSVPRFFNEYVFSRVTANKSVALDDSSYVYTSSNPYFPTMNAPTTFTRLMSNEWETIVLPFKVAANGADYNLYSFTSVNGELIELTKLSGNVAAGTPVLIHLAPVAMASNSDDYELTLTAVDPEVSIAIATPSVKDGLALTGTYKDIDLIEEPGYVVTDNDAYKISTVAGASCKPFHAYFAGIAAGSPTVLSLNSPDIPTGLDEIKALTSDGAEYYDIHGRRIHALQQGFNIVRFKDGSTQKVLVKE